MQDNIASPPAVNDTTDDYLKQFDNVSAIHLENDNIVTSFAEQPDDQHRLYAAMTFIRNQQKYNEAVYNLLVEMNNFFGTNK